MTRLSLRVRLRTLVAVSAALTAGHVALVVARPAEAEPYPTPGLSPVGANDWTCKPTAGRPYPAVIVHGTFGDQKSLLDLLSYTLVSEGFCVFALDYGNRATGPVEESAAELEVFVDQVLAATGAARVAMVGHSQGGMMPRYYIKYLGGATKVEDLVGLAPSNHGTTVGEAFGSGVGCTSCEQQMSGSDFLTALNNPDETPGEVDYTQVVTEYDEVVVPYTSGFLAPDAQSANITLQDRCPANTAEHLTIPTDRQAIAWVLDAFTRAGPADTNAAIGCR